jgi:hypothetical protein
MKDTRFGLPFAFAALSLAFACGGSNPPAPPAAAAPSRTAAGNEDLRRLMLDVAGTKACEKLRGKFIGLGGSEADANLIGAEQGLASVTGRWLIRDCKERSERDALGLRIGGPGWQWVDRAQKGFRIRQYVYFSAVVDLRGSLDVGYDPAAELASIWLTPVDAVGAEVSAAGSISPKAETVLASIVGAIGPTVGMAVDEVAKTAAGAEGTAQFKAKLAEGLTITFKPKTGQMDVLLGHLPNGVAPKRPFVTEAIWLLNERQDLFPAGLQMAGPFDPATRVVLDARVEQGSGLLYRLICQDDGQRAIDAVLRDEPLPIPTLRASGKIEAGGPASASITPPPCPWLLVTAPLDDKPAKVALQLVADASVPVAPAGAGAGSGSAWVKLTVLRFAFEPHKPDGSPWDPFGGAPDPELWIGTRAEASSVLVPRLRDTFAANPQMSSRVLEVSATSPLALQAKDIDITSDEPMGTAIITLEDVLAKGPEWTISFVLDGSPTGTARVRVDTAARP